MLNLGSSPEVRHTALHHCTSTHHCTLPLRLPHSIALHHGASFTPPLRLHPSTLALPLHHCTSLTPLQSTVAPPSLHYCTSLTPLHCHTNMVFHMVLLSQECRAWCVGAGLPGNSCIHGARDASVRQSVLLCRHLLIRSRPLVCSPCRALTVLLILY